MSRKILEKVITNEVYISDEEEDTRKQVKVDRLMSDMVSIDLTLVHFLLIFIYGQLKL